eukprot:TRINITY_DN7_c2_g1_i4.p1 TRINITY_DN7_c2_g1~~TRINITY_DN7_c2_g1_i4.p1  ORF type:complete len:286 (-),score=97.61 TRINITY_DN7_c2_g1_i4:73-930(-)
MGRLLGQLFNLIFPNLNLNPGGFALIGAAAFLGGVVRMTISLTVILIESTNDISYGMPIMLTLMISKWVGDYFTEGIYDYHIELNKIPLLGWDAPFNMRSVKTSEFMSHPPVTFQEVERVENIINVLKSTTHNGFPVTKSDGKFMGIILRHQLTILLKKKIFSETQEQSSIDDQMDGYISKRDFVDPYPRFPEVQDVNVTPEEMQYFINLAPYYNVRPATLSPETLGTRTYDLFRTLGLRHLVIVDSENKVVGMVTRKDLADFNHAEHSEKQRPPSLFDSDLILN